MSSIPVKDGQSTLFQLASVTLGDGTVAQAIVLVDPATGSPLQLRADGALPTGDENVRLALVAIANAMATAAGLAEVRDRLPVGGFSQPLTDSQLRAAPVPTQSQDDSFIMRWILKPLAKFTFTTYGLRVDCGGSSVNAALQANQTLATVTTLGAIGNNTQNGQAFQLSNHAFQNGFRRNLAVT